MTKITMKAFDLVLTATLLIFSQYTYPSQN